MDTNCRQIVGLNGPGECIVMDVSQHTEWLFWITTTDYVSIAVPAVCVKFKLSHNPCHSSYTLIGRHVGQVRQGPH